MRILLKKVSITLALMSLCSITFNFSNASVEETLLGITSAKAASDTEKRVMPVRDIRWDKTATNTQAKVLPTRTVQSKTVEKTTAATTQKVMSPTVLPARSTASQSATTQKAQPKTTTTKIIEKEQPLIRVLLGTRSSSFSVSSSKGMVLLDANRRTLANYGAGKSVNISRSGNTVRVDGKNAGTTAFLEPAQQGTIQTLGTAYRGKIKVTTTGSSMSVINEVPLESYLYGVVPKEAVPSWPMAALQAQAVAARTYALYNMQESKNKPYDVKPTTYHQVYEGKSAEFDATNKAVDSTRGMVMTYSGRPINALFHADGGGYTEDSVNVWGSHLPYLKGVKDYANNVDTSHWTVTTSRTGIERSLSSAGKGVGTLKSIILSPLGKRPIRASDRGISGRVKSATFVGSSRQVTISGENLMSIFGLRSTLFDFSIGKKLPSNIDSASFKAHHIFGKGNETVYISGYGWGHGLGMSQWGAAAMANKAPASDLNYYKNILNHYYNGIKIEKAY